MVEVEGELVPPYETEKAWHFYDGSRQAWLAKSLVDWHEKPGRTTGTMVMPEWLAEDKGFI